MLKIVYKYVLALFLIVFLSYCSDSIVESTPSIDENNEQIIVTPTFTDIQNNIFNKSCAFSGCHTAGSVNPDLSGNSHQNIVNKQSSTGMEYIKPNDADNSYLLHKVLGSNIINGSRMPLGNPPLSQANVDAIMEWINDDAKNN